MLSKVQPRQWLPTLIFDQTDRVSFFNREYFLNDFFCQNLHICKNYKYHRKTWNICYRNIHCLNFLSEDFSKEIRNSISPVVSCPVAQCWPKQRFTNIYIYIYIYIQLTLVISNSMGPWKTFESTVVRLKRSYEDTGSVVCLTKGRQL